DLITLDGKAHPLSERFMVVATENPIEQQGTYPLPEAQLDRFLFKHLLTYPDRAQELDIVGRHGHHSAMPKLEELGLSAEIVAYVVDLVRATREHASLQYGASPRAANMLATAARAHAAILGRD